MEASEAMPGEELLRSQVALLHRVSSIVSSHLSPDEILHELIGLAVEVTGCDACLVYLVEGDGSEIVLQASQLPHEREIRSLRMKVGEGVTGWVAEHKSVVALPSRAYADSRFKRFSTLVEDTYEAFLSAPLISGGNVIGVLNVHHKNPHPHTPEEVTLLTFVGEQLGGAIAKSRLAEDNARLMEETLELKTQLETRKLVERAKGLLQQKYNLTEEQAYLRLRDESRRRRRPLKELAEAIILAEDLGRQSDGLGRQLDGKDPAAR